MWCDLIFFLVPFLSFAGLKVVHAAPTAEPNGFLDARQDSNSPPSISSASSLAGINWFYAQAECGPQKLAELQRAFIDVTQLAYASIPPPSGDNPAFEEFFGVGYNGIYGKFFWRIFENLRKAGNFPYYGAGPGEANQISIHCKDLANRCPDFPNLPQYRTLAYTGSGVSTGQRGTIMVFCPNFWNQGFPHLLDRVKGKPTRALANLMTQEHVVLHELMHADIAGYQEHIEDIKTILPGEKDPQDSDIPWDTPVAVYGVRRCKLLAQQKSPPLKTLKNADSYAWFSTAKYFSDAWGITVNEPEGFVEGSADPIPPGYTVPDNGNWYGDNDFGDDEWST